MYDLIKTLTETWGPSGYEHHVRERIMEEVADLCDEMTVDGLGNLICKVGSGGKRIMMAAHMDEIGLMANYTEPKTGYLRFTGIGGIYQNSLFGNRVMFEDGTIGVIGGEDVIGKGRTSIPGLDGFFIDTEDETGQQRVSEGQPCSMWRETTRRGGRVIGKAMDDRIGCVVAIEAMRKLNRQAPNECVFVFTVQEEVGVRGARAAAYGVDPDIGIALDVTATGDEIHNRKMAVKLGGGAAIKIHDTSLIVPPAIINWMVNRAEADGIPYQRELLVGGGTDGSAIQVARAGVPTGCISIPLRYVHTTSETADLNDVQACIDLLAGLLSNPAALD